MAEKIYRLVIVNGCLECPYLAGPRAPGDSHYCHLLYMDFKEMVSPGMVVEPYRCRLASPGDPNLRLRPIEGCMDCPHCEERDLDLAMDNHCALTGLDFPTPWYYHQGLGTDMMDDFWTLPQCPLPTADALPKPISWADF